MDNDNILCSQLRLSVSHRATHGNHEGNRRSLSQYGHLSLRCFILPVVSRGHPGSGRLLTGDGQPGLMQVEFAPRLTGAQRPESHLTAENAAGSSSWLLMFSTSWPSLSVLATTATHSGSARKAPQRFSRSA